MANETDALRERMKRLDSGEEPDPKAILPVKESATIEVTVAELKQACEACPDHVHVRIFARAVESRSDPETITVDRVDLQAMLDDLDVEHYVRREVNKRTKQEEMITRKRTIPKGSKVRRERAVARKGL